MITHKQVSRDSKKKVWFVASQMNVSTALQLVGNTLNTNLKLLVVENSSIERRQHLHHERAKVEIKKRTIHLPFRVTLGPASFL